MPLAGLILGQGGRPNGALLQIAGQSLIEYQARSLRACGVQHIVVMVDTIPAAMVAAFDRLRGEGLSIDTARTAQEAADRIHPDETLLILAPGVVASPGVLGGLAALPPPAIATIPDEPAFSRFERIDRDDRWAGIGLVKGVDLRQTSATLGDWDLGPTLLRVALQRGAGRMRIPHPDFTELVEDEKQAADTSARLAANGSDTQQTPFARILGIPLARIGLTQAIRWGLHFEAVCVVAPALLLAALLLGWIGWPGIAFTVFAIASVGSRIARGMAACAIRNAWSIERYPVIEGVSFALLCLLAAADAAIAGWGIYVLAAWVALNAILRAGDARWRPGLDDLAILLALGFGTGYPVIGFCLAIAWQLVPSIHERIFAPPLAQR